MAWGFAILVPAGFLLFGFARMAAHDRRGDLAPADDRDPDAWPGRSGPTTSPPPTSCCPAAAGSTSSCSARSGSSSWATSRPPAVSRHVGSRWEIRGDRGRWVPIEAPLDRASRDAERVRGWLATHDRDFLVRVYAAIVTDDPARRAHADVRRRAAGRPRGWLEALPLQRGLNAERRERLVGAHQVRRGGPLEPVGACTPVRW